jgi:hypothetical protein
MMSRLHFNTGLRGTQELTTTTAATVFTVIGQLEN